MQLLFIKMIKMGKENKYIKSEIRLKQDKSHKSAIRNHKLDQNLAQRDRRNITNSKYLTKYKEIQLFIFPQFSLEFGVISMIRNSMSRVWFFHLLCFHLSILSLFIAMKRWNVFLSECTIKLKKNLFCFCHQFHLNFFPSFKWPKTY